MNVDQFLINQKQTSELELSILFLFFQVASIDKRSTFI